MQSLRQDIDVSARYVPLALTDLTGKEWPCRQRAAPQRLRQAQARDREHGGAHDVVERSSGAADTGGQTALGAAGQAVWLRAKAVSRLCGHASLECVYMCKSLEWAWPVKFVNEIALLFCCEGARA